MTIALERLVRYPANSEERATILLVGGVLTVFYAQVAAAWAWGKGFDEAMCLDGAPGPRGTATG